MQLLADTIIYIVLMDLPARRENTVFDFFLKKRITILPLAPIAQKTIEK